MDGPAEKLRQLVQERGEVANRDVAARLGISAATSHRLLRAFVTAGILERHGAGRAVSYRLRAIRRSFRLAGLDESRAWREIASEIARIRPLSEVEEQNLHYAATEMINNAIDHSGGRSVAVRVEFAAAETTIVRIQDDGVGVFRRLCEEFAFATPHDAIVQLEKGKLTSDPARHSGEGLFFSSKAVTWFRLESQGVLWLVDNRVGDSGMGPSDVRRGTGVTLAVTTGRVPRLEEVFAAFTDAETLSFLRTRTTIKLGSLGATLVSRSEAKRVTARLGEFRHAVLDFNGVDIVGQGFCDEVFRVFARAHPEVTLEPVGMNDSVAFMVARARAVS